MYEGVTADIIGIISGVLKTDIVAKQYPSREAAIKAVLVGDADFIGSSNSYEIGEGLDVTKPNLTYLMNPLYISGLVLMIII
ncbi:hypothetical protein A9X70_20345 [Aeromonas hydrophila]|nr:hypothetical protein A9X70_20345 [Aeromonas hydrophila]